MMIFALTFALFLFGLICLVVDSSYLYAWSGRARAAAQLAAQSGADSVDPRFLYGETQPCTSAGTAPACALPIVDTNPQDRTGSLYAFQRACIEAGDQSAEVPRDPPADGTPKTVDDPQVPGGTACASDGCRVFAQVTILVALPLPLPGFAQRVIVRGAGYAAPVVGTTAAAASTCSGTTWVPQPPPG